MSNHMIIPAMEENVTTDHWKTDGESSPASISEVDRLAELRSGVMLALDVGDLNRAKRLVEEAFEFYPSARNSDEWSQLLDVHSWTDSWLVAAIRCDPPDEVALDELVNRHWRALYGRCHMLTVDAQKANDLAQEAWCRLLRSRHRLDPAGNFSGYLLTIATNLWRDAKRSDRRAGALANHRLASLDAGLASEEGETVALIDILPDLNSIDSRTRANLAIDIDAALNQLSQTLRDVLVARFVVGESCAEIGQRYGRTEQSVSGWIRQGIRELKSYLEANSTRGLENAYE